MSDLFRRFATPFMTGFFLISLVSGVALFFHVGQASFHEMHEWLSMVLIIPFALHLWRNWRAMMAYVGRAPLSIAAVASIVVALAFAWPSLSGTAEGGRAGGPPQFGLANAVVAQPLSKVAPLVGQSPEALVTVLKGQGYAAAAPGLTLVEIARQSGRETGEIMSTLTSELK